MVAGETPLSEDMRLIRAELYKQVREMSGKIEKLQRRDPQRNKLYDARAQILIKIREIDARIVWETESEVLQRTIPEKYGAW